MKRTQLWKILCAFDKKDIREFRKFVHSPFFNQREDVTQLFEMLAEHLKGNKTDISKEAVFELMFPNEAFDAKRIHLLSSLLNGHCEQYLIWKERAADEVEAKIILAKAYRKLKLDKPFVDTIEEAKQLHENQPLRNAEYHEKKYNLLLEEFDYAIQNKRLEDFNLQEVLINLDKTFVSRFLRLECAILSHQAVAKKEYESGVFNINNISDKLINASAIAIYQHGYQAIKNNDEATFDIFMELLKRDSSKFPMNEQKDMFLMANNFCIKQFNAGKENFAFKALELYKNGLKQKVLIENNIISRFTFNNIVRSAILVKDWDWAEDFIKQYADKLELAYRESITSFSLGRIAYERKQYGNALVFLQRAEGHDFLINLNIKVTITKIFYETTDFKVLESHLNAVKVYISRQKEAGYQKKLCENFIKFTTRLLNLNINKSSGLEKLETDIMEEKNLMERKWLLAQIEALRHRKIS